MPHRPAVFAVSLADVCNDQKRRRILLSFVLAAYPEYV